MSRVFVCVFFGGVVSVALARFAVYNKLFGNSAPPPEICTGVSWVFW